MKKREFLKTGGLLAAGSLLLPLNGCGNKPAADSGNTPNTAGSPSFELPPLGYDYAALEPHIDAETMRLHHGKHHQGYVTNLNKALADSGNRFAGKDLEALLAELKPEDTALRNHAGGHFNHSLYWSILGPATSAETRPEGKLAAAIDAEFGSFDQFKAQLTAAAMSRFGSGWAWLCRSETGKLFISSTPNQDNPLMRQIAEQPGTPLLGIDVWEHAYYLHYQNRRADYVQAFYALLRWDKIAERFVG